MASPIILVQLPHQNFRPLSSSLVDAVAIAEGLVVGLQRFGVSPRPSSWLHRYGLPSASASGSPTLSSAEEAELMSKAAEGLDWKQHSPNLEGRHDLNHSVPARPLEVGRNDKALVAAKL